MRKNILRILIFSGIFCTGFYLGENTNEKKHEKDVVITNPDLITLTKVWEVLQDNFTYNLDNEKQKKMKDGAIQGMLSSIDPHSFWWNDNSQNLLEEKLKGEYGGIGIRYIYDSKIKMFKIISVKKDGPAYKSGVKVNDILFKINGILYENNNFIDAIRGKIGSELSLEIKRNGELLKMNMHREKITNFSVYSKINVIDKQKWINIRITDFQETTVNDIASEIRNNWFYKNEPNHGIILDLRSSPGGLVDVSAGVASLFLPPNKRVTSIKERNQNNVIFNTINFSTEAWTSWAKNVPLIIWVDDKTASAAEILASALKDNGRTTFIIGTPTFGKGTVQRTFLINKNEQATFTIGFYKTPNDHYLQWKGVVPDVSFKYPDDVEKNLKEQHENNIISSLPPPIKEKDVLPKIEIDIPNDEIKNKTIDDIYLDKTTEILQRSVF